MPYAPDAKVAIDIIRDIYVVEHDAKAAGVARSVEHTEMRRARSRPIMDRFRAWLDEQRPLFSGGARISSASRSLAKRKASRFRTSACV